MRTKQKQRLFAAFEIVQWSRARKHYERQGILVTAAAIESPNFTARVQRAQAGGPVMAPMPYFPHGNGGINRKRLVSANARQRAYWEFARQSRREGSMERIERSLKRKSAIWSQR